LAQEDSSQKWDLSEEWLEYLAVRGSDDDGSWASRNFYLLKKSGVLRESHWPYDPSEWTEFDELSEKYCGKLKNQEKLYKSCLLIHRDPRLLDASDDELKNEQSELYDLEFLKFKETAPKVRDELNVVFTKNLNYAYSEKEVKALLDQGQPLILGIDFYYGAWNHRLMTEYGIGERNMESWNSGVVGYPSLGSLDREISVKPKNRAGHAIVIIGYDDNVVVTQKIKMKNGHMKTYHYKGVYYFKNSWGADSFGKDMVLEGEKSPGYGMITQRYAHEFGSFTYIE